MSEWKTYKLGKDVVTKLGDGLHGTPIYDDNGEYYFINGSNLVDGKIVINSNTKKVTEAEYIKYKKDLSEKTILLGINGTIGNVAIYKNEKCILGKSAAYLNINDVFDKQFIRYVLTNDHFQNYIKNNASGTTIKNVGLGLLRDYEFLAPCDKVEQQQIAQILTSLDDKIELNLQMNQTLEAMAQALFKEWFVNFNFPNFDGELKNGLPKCWRMGKLGEEFNLTMGQSPKGETLNQDNEGMIFYQGRTDFGFRFPSNRICTTEPNRIANRLDTLVCVRAPVGDVNMAIEKCCIGRGLSAVMHKTNSYSYTYYSMKNIEPIFKGFESEGTVFGSLNKNNFENIEVVIPSEALIKEFEKVVNPIDEKILINSFQIQTLTQTRDTLLPKLMSGKIKINE